MTGMTGTDCTPEPSAAGKKVIFLHLFQKERERERTATGVSRGFMSMLSKEEKIVFAGFLVCQMFHVPPGPWNFRFPIFTFVGAVSIERKHAEGKKNTF